MFVYLLILILSFRSLLFFSSLSFLEPGGKKKNGTWETEKETQHTTFLVKPERLPQTRKGNWGGENEKEPQTRTRPGRTDLAGLDAHHEGMTFNPTPWTLNPTP